MLDMVLVTLLALGLPSLAYGIYAYFRSLRRVFADVPGLKRHLFWGHMLEMPKYVKADRHPDYGLMQMYEDLGQPDIFFLDVQPLHKILVVSSPTIAEQISKASSTYPVSTPKSWTIKDIYPLVGKSSILVTNGEDWRVTRKQFQPGFQPKHLQTLLPLIIAETRIFVSNLMEKTRSNEPFELGFLVQSLTLDVISSIALGESFHAQTTPDGQGPRAPDGILTAFHQVQINVTDRSNITLNTFNPLRLWKLSRLESILNKKMREAISNSFTSLGDTSRTVVHLALKGRKLTPAVIEEAADQLRTFIFAGYDTTSTVIQYFAYYLSLPVNLSILEKLMAEHDQILGPVNNKEATEAVLLTDPLMPYTTAVIKEILRLQPPGASARWVEPTPTVEPFHITTSEGETYQINGSPIYINHKIIHNSTKIWGLDAAVFRPERWLDKEYMAKLPVGAFRPFERGPRACIGQELAMMEAKIVISLMTRQFIFKKATIPGTENDLGEVWNIYRISTGPQDGMRMTVKTR